ncbi:Late competence protein ComGA, access of DNA to ComEA [Alkalibacterium sp. AK22]|uniref:competence type IV pilus ATPase ComGA n=1 Tax=Alkalibacterium sp. AK22 TaxID=1229520 RepID=UPI00044D27E8|nr:competence type IV pilus ATPase ComGA [Alkalibacterium sp. AK22]EXJ22779.1 Late competence protein ComGA, access of DNA to ComEA [Alkalibacterium sp. AK22]
MAELDTELFATHLLTLAEAYKTSDVHILPEQKHYDLYFRLNGQMSRQFYLDKAEGGKLISYFKFLSNMDVGEKRRPQSGSMTFKLKDKTLDLRFSTISNYHSQESLVIRLLKQTEDNSKNFGSFFSYEWKQLKKLIDARSGLLLFAGPVDSGKTTTMYHLVKNRLEGEKQQVITVEDPVEIEEAAFLQCQVNETAGISYEHLLKSSLRHHPDVIIVGEIRDEETARMVVRGALTGHLIVASIHAKNCQGVLSRLMELGISQPLLQQTLIGIAFQNLVPLYCPLCEANCQTFCGHYPRDQKRAALFEVKSGKQLKEWLQADLEDDRFDSKQNRDFNHLLTKARTYGYISEKTYERFTLPN